MADCDLDDFRTKTCQARISSQEVPGNSVVPFNVYVPGRAICENIDYTRVSL